jgi:uncharacterized protein (DUF1778 family)
MTAAIQSKSERTWFELSPAQWLAFRQALEHPTSAKPNLKKLLSKPGLLG